MTSLVEEGVGYVTPAGAYTQNPGTAPKSMRNQMQQKPNDKRMIGLSPLVRGLQRGFICQDPTLTGFGGGPLRRFSFLFNPSTLPVSYQSSGEIVDGSTAGPNDSPGAKDPAINAAGGTSLSFSLLLDRTYETWNDKSSRGVMEDVIQLEKMTGWSEDNPWMQIANYCHIFLGPYQHFYGVITSLTVTYTNWTQFLVPNRASVDLSFTIYPLGAGAASAAAAVSSTATGPAGASQIVKSQIPQPTTAGVHSQNGWDAGSETRAHIKTYTVPGTGIPLRINQTAAPMLLYVASQFNTRVEGLRGGGDCSGYNDRFIRHSTTVESNHGSGTAIDLNASLHPQGQSATDPAVSFSPAQTATIGTILLECSEVVRWGGNYHGRKDPMHFEITDGIDSPTLLRAIAQLP